jgi:hypothetical protein
MQAASFPNSFAPIYQTPRRHIIEDRIFFRSSFKVRKKVPHPLKTSGKMEYFVFQYMVCSCENYLRIVERRFAGRSGPESYAGESVSCW